MSENIMNDDFPLICRVCLKFKNNLIPISMNNIIEMMISCASIQIWINDNLPNQICAQCLDNLKIAFNFKQLSEESDKYLRGIFDHKVAIIEDNKNIKLTISEIDNCNDRCSDTDSSITIKNKLEENANIENNVQTKLENRMELRHQCDYCDFSSNHLHHLNLHMKRYHNTIRHECNKCKQLFINANELKKHLNSHTSKHFKLKKCKICHKTFGTRSKLMRHNVVHTDERPFQCTICGRNFKLNSSLNIHLNIAHSKDSRVPCDVCGKHVMKAHIARHLLIHKNNRDMVQCNQCDKKFLHHSSLKQHIRRDHEKIARELNHLCIICGKKYESRVALERHSVVHKPERPYKCNQCGKGFKLDFTLTKHIKTMHSDSNVHIRLPCKVCGKFISKTNIQTHMKIHQNIRNMIKCNQCSKQFLHQISLKQHIKRDHENVARELKHLCNICGRGAGSRAELAVHMLSHSDEKTFKCDKCSMKYKSRAGLTHHINTTHLNIKPHACTICSHRFALRATLATHMRTHTGERPFKCVICEKSFSQKSSLRTHMKLVHSNITVYSEIKSE